MSIYRTMQLAPEPKPPYVQVSRNVSVRRDWISSVDPDGTVWRKDGVSIQGDPDRLREEGLL